MCALPESFIQNLYRYMAYFFIAGILDNATLTLMSKPRCGAPDIMNSTELSFRKKRYLVIGKLNLCPRI